MKHVAALVIGFPVLLAGCGGPAANNAERDPSAKQAPEVKEKPRPARVSNRPANEDGVVFIVEYHKVAKEEARWDRSISRFKSDLTRFYNLGFRPVSMESYLKGKFDLAPGASPIIFTFDDAHPSQFRMLPDGTIDPDCAVGLWKKFEESHPDFPVIATFYVLPVMWGQPEELPKKLAFLKEWGSDLGSHTINHHALKKLSQQQAKEELAGGLDLVKRHGFSGSGIALPYGISPQDPEMLKSFEFQGKTYTHSHALLVGANPAPSPKSTKFNRMRLPRIQCIEGDYGITYWLDKLEKGEVKPYVQP